MLGMQSLLDDILHIEQTSRNGDDEADIGARLGSARRSLSLALEALRRDRAGQVLSRADRPVSSPSRPSRKSGLRRA